MISFNNKTSLLRPSLFLLLFFLSAAQTSITKAQSNVTAIESLPVDIWPEYDRESVLVLLTGFLPAGAPLPATITIPVPDNADINAVARITEDGSLFSDITFDDSVSGQVTLTTPDARFRVEYYMPYNQDGEERTFTFEWESDVTVTEMLVSVQQPVATSELTTNPEASNVTTRQDGFQYHNLAPVTVPAGDSFSVEVAYSRSVSQVSAELLQPSDTAEPTTGNQPNTPSETGLNWPTILLVSAGVAVLAVGAWMLFGERLVAARRPAGRSRPAPVSKRPKKRKRERETAVSDSPSKARYCHHCGQKSEPDDRFCRSCGTRLKN